MSDKASKGKKGSILGLGLFFLIIIWAMWHGVIGPRVIEPTPGTQEAPAPDPTREPPRE